jgi:hypothetical protein
LAARAYSQMIADRFRNCHLALACNRGCHDESPKVIPLYYMVIPDKMSTTADG